MNFLKQMNKSWNILQNTSLAMLALSALLLASPSAEALTVTAQQDVGNITAIEVLDEADLFAANYVDPSVTAAARKDVAQAFYQLHKDEYDFFVFFTDFDYAMPSGAEAFYHAVRNDVQGIGMDPLYDLGLAYGSDSRLQGTVDFGNVADPEMVLDPLDPGFNTSLYILTHEIMHRWGANLRFVDGGGQTSDALRMSATNDHWSFLFDSDSSTLYGNHWQDNGDGTFTSIPPTTSLLVETDLTLPPAETGRGKLFSPLELYAMGMIDKSEVPPMLLIDNPAVSPNQYPRVGETISGTALTVTIDDIIAAEGERIPAAADAQKNFRTAFVLVTKDLAAIDPAHLRGIEALRSEWITRFSILTDGAALMEVTPAMPLDDGLASNPGVTDPVGTLHLAANVNDGVSWLQAQQLPDGSWQDASQTSVRDTAAALAALQGFAAAALDVAEGEIWLSASSTENTDYLARKVAQLKDAASIAALLAAQNADGGWGSAPGYMSNPADTALALNALDDAAHPLDGAVTTAVNYLLAVQNAEGGWGISGLTSFVQPTSYALVALDGYRAAASVDPALVSGLAWLKAKQNPDGGFGNSPSTIYDTAVATDALMLLDGDRSAVDSAADFMLASQFDDGSWNNSSYQTALAVDLLEQVQIAPDLTVSPSDFSFSPDPILAVPADVTVTVTVHNLGSSDAAAVDVALYEDDPALGNLVGSQSVAVSGGGSTAVVFNHNITSEGDHTFYAVLDETGLIAEASEQNNSASATVAAAVPPPTVGFTLDQASSGEDAGTVLIEVSLDHASPRPVSVDYAVNLTSSAAAGSDYMLADGTLNFAAQQLTQTIAVQILDDGLGENDETLIIDLSNPVEAFLGTTRHTHTITDNEPVVVSISSPLAGITTDPAPQLLYSVSHGTVTVKVDGGAVSKVSGELLDPLADGPHSVVVEAAASSATGSASVSFTVDTVAPAVTVSEPVQDQVYATVPNLVYTASDATSGVAQQTVRLDGVVVALNSGDNLGPLVDGPHTVSVEAVDAAGLSTTTTINFTMIEQTIPLVTISAPSAGYTSDPAPQLLYSVSHGTVSVKVDDLLVGKLSGDLLDPLADGPHTVLVEAAASVGTGSDSVTFTLDSVPPVVTLSEPVQEQVYIVAPNLIYTASDATSGVVQQIVRLDGNIVPLNSGESLGALAVGAHNVSVEAVDAAGLSTTTAVTFFMEASTPPSVAIIAPASGYSSDPAPQLLYSVSHGTVTVKVDDLVVSKVSGDLLDPLSEGPHTLAVESLAVAGTGSDSVTFSIDSVPPQVDITEPLQDQAYAAVPDLVYSANDATSGVVLETVRLDGNLVALNSGDNLGALAYGAHTVAVEAVDAAGLSTTTSINFTLLDLAPPTITLASPVHGDEYDTEPVLNYTAADVSGIAQTVGYLNDVQLSPFYNGMTLAGVVSGNNKFVLEVTDTFGNVATVTVYFLWGTGTNAKLLEKTYPEENTTGYGAPKSKAFDLITDANGDVYLFGSIQKDISTDTHWDLQIIIQRSDGSEERRPNLVTTSGLNECGQAIASDDAGYLYLAWGEDASTQGYQKVRDRYAHCGLLEDVTIAKYEIASGNFVWQTSLSTVARDTLIAVNDLALDSAGNIYVTGHAQDHLDRKDPAILGATESYLVKLDSSGGVVWRKYSGAPGDDIAGDLFVDQNDYVYATWNDGLIPHVQKYDGLGNSYWNSQFLNDVAEGVTGAEKVYAVHVDNAGSLVAVGEDSAYDLFVAKYDVSNDASITNLWQQFIVKGDISHGDYHGYNWEPNSDSLAVDSKGNIYVVGYTAGDFEGFVSYQLWNGFIAQYDPLGNKKWSDVMFYHGDQLYGDTDTTFPARVVAGDNDHIYVGGSYGVDGSYGLFTDASLVEYSGDQSGNIVVAPTGLFNVDQVTLDVSTSAEIISLNAEYDGQVFACAPVVANDWTCTIPGLKDGNNNILLVGDDSQAQQYFSYLTVTTDLVPPAVAITTVSSPLNISSQTVSGTMEDGANITVAIDSAAVLGAVSYPNATSWSVDISALVEGANTLTVTASDAAGNSADAIAVIVYDTLPPLLSVDPLSTPTLDPDQTVTGVRESGATLSASIDSGATLSAISYPSGTTWSVAVTGMDIGLNNLSLTATDQAGNDNLVVATIELTQPQTELIVNPVTTPTNILNQTLSGYMEDGATVTLSADTAVNIGVVSYPTSSTWACTLTGLVEGLNNITINAVGSLTKTANVSIVLDSVLPTIGFELASAAVSESQGSLVYTVVLDKPWFDPVSADLSVAAETTATSSDYVLNTLALSFAPGEVSQSVSVDILSDHLVEPAEIVALDLVNLVAASAGSSRLTIDITDDDVAPSLTIDTVTPAFLDYEQTLTGTIAVGASLDVEFSPAADIAYLNQGGSTWSVVVKLPDNGSFDATVTATDAYGNTTVLTTPLTATEADYDGDGWAWWADNCEGSPNPAQEDLDGDGFGDACDGDIDGDGLLDSWETSVGLNPFDPADALLDADGDGLDNLTEYQMGSDVFVADAKERLAVGAPLDLGVAITGVAGDGNYLAAISPSTSQLFVVDVSDPLNPVEVSNLTLSGVPVKIAAQGSLAYVTAGDSGLLVVDFSTPTAPFETGVFNTRGHATDIVVDGSTAYVNDGSKGLKTIDITDPTSPSEMDSYIISKDTVLGIAAGDGFAYLTTASNNLHIVDATNPFSIFLVNQVPLYDAAEPWFAPEYAQYRPTYYKNASGVKFVYLSNFLDEKYGDVWHPPNRQLRQVHVTDPTYVPFVSESKRGFFTHAEVVGDALYLTEPKDEYWASNRRINHVARVWKLDVTSQTYPRTIDYAWSYGLAEDVDFVNGQLFVANGTQGVKVFAPQVNDEIVFTEEILGTFGGMDITSVGVKDDLAYMSHLGGLSVYDFADTGNVTEVYNAATIPVGRVTVSGNTLVVSAGASGAYIFDVSSPAQPALRKLLPMERGAAAALNNQTAFIVDQSSTTTSDLTIVDISDPWSPQQITTFDAISSNCIDVALDKGVVYMLCEGNTVVPVDVSNPASPQAFPEVYIPGSAWASRITVAEGLLFVASEYANPSQSADPNSLFVAELAVPGYPVFVPASPMAEQSRVLADHSGLYIDTRDDGFCKIDASNPGMIQKKQCLLPLSDNPYYDDSYLKTYAKIGEYVLVDKLNLGMRAIRVDVPSLVRGSVEVEAGAFMTSSDQVTLDLNCLDPRGACTEMRFSNDGSLWSDWQPYALTASWQLSSGDGLKSVSVQFAGSDGSPSNTASDTITLDTQLP